LETIPGLLTSLKTQSPFVTKVCTSSEEAPGFENVPDVDGSEDPFGASTATPEAECSQNTPQTRRPLATPGAIVAEEDSEVIVTPSVPGGSNSGAEVCVDDYEDVLGVADCDEDEGDGEDDVDGLHDDGLLLETVLEDEDGSGVPLAGLCLFMQLHLKPKTKERFYSTLILLVVLNIEISLWI
jgi:hypothetical protein